MEENMNGISRRVVSGLIALLIASCAIAQPAPAKSVNVIVFTGGFNWPIWMAQEKGLFVKNGIEVRVTPTVSSVFQLTNLIDGKFDIAMTAIDNLIAYREGQGEEPVLGRDLQAVMGGDTRFLRLLTLPEVTSYSQLPGKTPSGHARPPRYPFLVIQLLARARLEKSHH